MLTAGALATRYRPARVFMGLLSAAAVKMGPAALLGGVIVGLPARALAEGMVTNPVSGQRYQLLAVVLKLVLLDLTVKFPVEGFVRLTPIGG